MKIAVVPPDNCFAPVATEYISFQSLSLIAATSIASSVSISAISLLNRTTTCCFTGAPSKSGDGTSVFVRTYGFS